MTGYTPQRKPLTAYLLLARLVPLVLLMMALSSCTTKFPENPEKHRLFKELQAASHEYYFLVRKGVASRVMGIQPEAQMRELLRALEARWGDVDSLDASDALINYFRANGLAPIAERVEETLSRNEPSRPPDLDPRLEAGAIKQGLVDAFYEVQRE
ncbi:MAG: hypothetical protein ACE5NA_04435 [Nitrospiraceae bacterium]